MTLFKIFDSADAVHQDICDFQVRNPGRKVTTQKQGSFRVLILKTIKNGGLYAKSLS